MGRLTRWLAAPVLALGVLVAGTDAAAAFDGFGEPSAESVYGEELTFRVPLRGAAPERLELLISTQGSDGSIVIPIDGTGDVAEHTWLVEGDYLTPNTLVTYRFRAIHDGQVTESAEAKIRHDDDRREWQSVQLGEATVHWYGDADATARRFGELSAIGVERAEQLMGTELAGPVDVFVYGSRDDFFGALGPGAREWTGAAAYSELRTIFMWNSPEAGSAAYLETAMIHEVTHIVFHDATDNPFHDPARWLNEGIATWSESGSDAGEQSIVESEARSGGLFSFEAITEQFPIGERGGRLSYAQGTAMVDIIISTYGREAIAGIMAAYREGASDAEALEAGTGVPAEQLYADFYASFGVEAPEPIEPETIPPSDVDRPSTGAIDPGGVDPGAEPDVEPDVEPSPGEPERGSGMPAPLVVAALAVGLALAGGGAWAMSRRADRRAAR